MTVSVVCTASLLLLLLLALLALPACLPPDLGPAGRVGATRVAHVGSTRLESEPTGLRGQVRVQPQQELPAQQLLLILLAAVVVEAHRIALLAHAEREPYEGGRE